jgi:predicted TIM-barrel fold metal-dependent hydrolase
MATQVSEQQATTDPAPAQTSRSAKRRSFPIIDTDVHHGYRDKSDLYPYLSKTYRERLEDYGFGSGVSYNNNGGLRGYRADALKSGETLPGGGGVSATDVELLQTQLLDDCGIDIAILTGGQAYGTSAMMDVEYANAICRAFNDYTLEHWVAKDSRLRHTLAVNTQDPIAAAEEIARLGDDPNVVGIMIPCGATKPYGHKFYHPIWEACEQYRLAIAMHFGAEGSGINPPPTSAGYPTNYIEGRMARPNFYSVHVASFIFEGVFEKFPALRVAMVEAGFAWVPPLMWRMDLDWKGLRYQTPWVQKLPSEYLREHIRFASQPMEEPHDPRALQQIIEWMDGKQTLMFATDYPHWDWDDPAMSFTGLPDDLRRRIFSGNAAETFGLTIDTVQAADESGSL